MRNAHLAIDSGCHEQSDKYEQPLDMEKDSESKETRVGVKVSGRCQKGLKNGVKERRL